MDLDSSEDTSDVTLLDSTTDVEEYFSDFEKTLCREHLVVAPLTPPVTFHPVIEQEIQGRDPQLTQLLLQMRQKYSGEAQHSQCFPENPDRTANLQYIQFADLQEEDRSGNVEWCKCGHCSIMPTNLESICCLEIENCEPYIQGTQCITFHEFFSIFCTREDTVNLCFRMLGEFKKPPPKKEEKRLCRKTAYRAFTAWVHGYLGIGNRRPIPSCVVKKVRSAFPEESGEYLGFIPSNDSPAEFMAFE